jgi:hypothetical protein
VLRCFVVVIFLLPITSSIPLLLYYTLFPAVDTSIL